jgi:hypothetical protein
MAKGVPPARGKTGVGVIVEDIDIVKVGVRTATALVPGVTGKELEQELQQTTTSKRTMVQRDSI